MLHLTLIERILSSRLGCDGAVAILRRVDAYLVRRFLQAAFQALLPPRSPLGRVSDHIGDELFKLPMRGQARIVLNGEVRSLRLDRRLSLDGLLIGTWPALRPLVLGWVHERRVQLDSETVGFQVG